MTELENKIYKAIAEGTGLKGAEIANRIGEEKKTVNSILSRSVALKALVTQDENYRWHLKNLSAYKTKGNTEALIPNPDPDLRNICNYYLNCIAIESSNSVSQFLSGKYESKYAFIKGLTIDSQKDKSTIQLLSRINSDRSKAAYMGYPVRVFSFRGRNGELYKKIAPVFLFPVSYSGGQIEIAEVPSINMEVLKGYTDSTPDALVVELINLETDLGLNVQDSDIELDELVLRLTEIRQWDYRERIDPYKIISTELNDTTEDGIYNRAIVIEAERDIFTQGLESELMTLANMPVENYEGTALYAWIKGKANLMQNGEIKPLLEVLPLNSEQAEAVNTALRSDLTIVTGPPGTGKSQVVTDLLVNIVWNGKSALFSSKNNKAVDVVDQRVNGLCKRPVVLRIGGNQYAYRLAEIIEGLLNSHPKSSDQEDTEFYLKQYAEKTTAAEQILSEKNETIQARNRLDETEQQYCLVRNKVGNYLQENDTPAKGQITKAAEQYVKAHNAACKERQNFFVQLFWSAFSEKRKAAEQDTAQFYNNYALHYNLITAAEASAQSRFDDLMKDAASFDQALDIGRSYKTALDAFKRVTPLEKMDRALAENKENMAKIASNLWNKWLVSQAVSFSAEERQEMSAFVSAMKLSGDINLADYPELKKQFTKMAKQMTQYLQCWAVTSLSAKSRIPFEAGIFDYVIIDEASQCDIASILPLLYRAKHAVIIGDPKQLSHISQLSRKQDLALLQKYHVSPEWSYSTNSLYALAEGKVATDQIVQLKDHFRCCADIIEFSNEEFYDGSLRTATRYSGLKTPAGEKPGIRWINVAGRTIRPNSGSAYNPDEANAVVQELKRLVSAGYQGSIGVTTPFRRQAEEIRSILEKQEPRLYDSLLKHHEFIADTVHKFQGDERDLMIFSPVVSNGTPKSTLGFLESTGNLFNVAITRARAVLVVIGNYQYCANSSVSYLSSFAAYYSRLSKGELEKQKQAKIPDTREYPWVANPEQVSDWERWLYTALYDAGIQTIPQYPADKYKLDLAIVLENGRKLDIEVDGEMYHRQWNGELCYRDQLRNQRMYELGWDVIRFWVYQIRDDLPWCIEQVKIWLAGE